MLPQQSSNHLCVRRKSVVRIVRYRVRNSNEIERHCVQRVVEGMMLLKKKELLWKRGFQMTMKWVDCTLKMPPLQTVYGQSHDRFLDLKELLLQKAVVDWQMLA
jgi:hypothetical protein